jgi:hypothetical protein
VGKTEWGLVGEGGDWWGLRIGVVVTVSWECRVWQVKDGKNGEMRLWVLKSVRGYPLALAQLRA